MRRRLHMLTHQHAAGERTGFGDVRMCFRVGLLSRRVRWLAALHWRPAWTGEWLLVPGDRLRAFTLAETVEDAYAIVRGGQ